MSGSASRWQTAAPNAPEAESPTSDLTGTRESSEKDNLLRCKFKRPIRFLDA
jgi:hypothetical protein